MFSRSFIQNHFSIAVLLVASASSQASVLFEQTPINGGDGLFSNESSGAYNAERFSLATASRITDIHWWGSYASGVDDDHFNLRVLRDNAGSPGASVGGGVFLDVAVARAATVLTDVAGATVYEYALNLPSSLDLAAGSYYLDLTDETLNTNWFWLFGNDGDGQVWSGTSGSTWSPAISGDFALRVGGDAFAAAPEPGVLGLLLAALPAFFLTGARRRA